MSTIKTLAGLVLLARLVLATAPVRLGNPLADHLWDGDNVAPSSVTRLASSRQMQVRFAGFTLAGDDGLTRLSMPDTSPSAPLFAPELPLVRLVLLVPSGITLHMNAEPGPVHTFALHDLGFSDPLPMPLPPAVKRPARLRSALPCTQPGTWGERAATLQELPSTAAGHPYLLELHPFAYHFPEHTLLYRENLTITLTCSPPIPRHAAAPVLPRRLLMAAPAAWQPALDDFRTVRESQGWQTAFMAAGSDPILLRENLRHLYHRTPFTHLLLIGDSNLIPPWRGMGTDSPPTDLYYACYDGEDDWLPEVSYGRLPLARPDRLADILGRTLAGPQPAFLAPAQPEQWTETCHEEIIDRHLLPRALTPRRLYARQAATTIDDTLQFLYQPHTGPVTYSGHGNRLAWLEPPLDRSSIIAATPAPGALVISLACLTGDFSPPEDECLAAAWLQAGATAVIAASGDTYWAEDACLENGLFDAWFEDGATTLGDMLLQAKWHVLAQYGDSADTRQYWEQYHLLGDPTQPLPIFPGLSRPPPASASRRLPTTPIAPEMPVSVTIALVFAEPRPAACILNEHLPPGWSLQTPHWNGQPVPIQQDHPGHARLLFGWNLPVGNGQLTYAAMPGSSDGNDELLFAGNLTTTQAIIPVSGDLRLIRQRQWNTLEITLPTGWSFHSLPAPPDTLPPGAILFAADGTRLPARNPLAGQPFWLFNPGEPSLWRPGGYASGPANHHEYPLGPNWRAIGHADPMDTPAGHAFTWNGQTWNALTSPPQPGQAAILRIRPP